MMEMREILEPSVITFIPIVLMFYFASRKFKVKTYISLTLLYKNNFIFYPLVVVTKKNQK